MKNKPKKIAYRIGDAFKIGGKELPTTAPGWVRNFTEQTLFHYKDTIAAEYLIRTKKFKDHELLKKIISEFKIKKNVHIPSQNEWVVHIRTGDVIDKAILDVDDFCKEYIRVDGKGLAPVRYVSPLSTFRKKIEKAKNKNITNVTICSAFHLSNNNEKSELYLSRVFDLFKDFNLTKRINKFTPDEDFIYMCNSKYFTYTNGGFSHIAKSQVQMNNGILL